LLDNNIVKPRKSNPKKLNDGHYLSLFRQWWLFFQEFYDIRDEYEKDIWNIKKICPVKIEKGRANYCLNFSPIADDTLKRLAKSYIKARLTTNSLSTVQRDLNAIRLFINFYWEKYKENTLINLQRNRFEEFLNYFYKFHENATFSTRL